MNHTASKTGMTCMTTPEFNSDVESADHKEQGITRILIQPADLKKKHRKKSHNVAHTH
ncbi:hypothetical protein KKF34_06180 [Myxococcota bacterium]|nr:hypothetical protein [Myxococcota bacterium]MBU1383030.1 hypothetical protein [Myxococcota bacterium]MBU1496448.1 hypothetical protein [Myxococcota bacterium]